MFDPRYVMDVREANPMGDFNDDTVFTRTNNTRDATKDVTITRTFGGHVYQQVMYFNSDSEILHIFAWTQVS